MRLALSAAALLAAAVLCGCADDVPAGRLPRFEPEGRPAKVALVLGSGGPRGFAHVGVLKVLEENGIKPDLVVGASVGAVVGIMHAAGVKSAEIERVALDLDLKRFFLDWRLLFGRLPSGGYLQAFVNDYLKGRTIESLPTRFAATASRASDHRLVVFNRGDPGLALRASSAVAGQFEPVKVGDEMYMDGDETSPVPILAARALGAQVVIAVDVSAYAETTPPGVPREWVLKDERRAKQVKKEAPAADILLHPDIGYYAGHSDEYRRRVIAIAERYTREKMPEIRRALAKVNG